MGRSSSRDRDRRRDDSRDRRRKESRERKRDSRSRDRDRKRDRDESRDRKRDRDDSRGEGSRRRKRESGSPRDRKRDDSDSRSHRRSRSPADIAERASKYAKENGLSREMEKQLRALSPDHLKAVLDRGTISKAEEANADRIVEGRIRAESRKWQKNRRAHLDGTINDAPSTGRWGKRFN
eukprot:TRINITY_DN71620_c0_g1_i1.p1 TRINITY_DN71620_c0_g1~~TRINITY_DN71620_c0_g1_i1.p1  ORF type:complete len:210 (+),score=48.32 TRINITY_DN71620_c0_g1_i1:93-632(+)